MNALSELPALNGDNEFIGYNETIKSIRPSRGCSEAIGANEPIGSIESNVTTGRMGLPQMVMKNDRRAERCSQCIH